MKQQLDYGNWWLQARELGWKKEPGGKRWKSTFNLVLIELKRRSRRERKSAAAKEATERDGKKFAGKVNDFISWLYVWVVAAELCRGVVGLGESEPLDREGLRKGIHLIETGSKGTDKSEVARKSD